MTSKEKRKLKASVISKFNRFNALDHTATIGSLRDDILRYINSMQEEHVELKEVDLEKEIKDYFNNQPIITRSKGVDYQLIPSGEKIAKHFFELGRKVAQDWISYDNN